MTYRQPLCMGRKPATTIKRNVDRRAFSYSTARAPYGMPSWAFNAVLLATLAIGIAFGAYGIAGL